MPEKGSNNRPEQPLLPAFDVEDSSTQEHLSNITAEEVLAAMVGEGLNLHEATQKLIENQIKEDKPKESSQE